jgi:ribosomal protein S18 acetylase RimI-like enzyme
MIEFIRVTEQADIAMVADLARSIWTGHYVPIIGKDQVDYMLARFQSAAAITDQIAGGYAYYLVREAGQPAGYFALVSAKDSPSVMLSKIYVKADLRGKGVGRAILEYADQAIRAAGGHELWLTVNRNNTGSIAFYERMGFRKAGLLKQDIGNGFIMDDYKMVKDLD